VTAALVPTVTIEDTPREYVNRGTVINQVTVSYGTWGDSSRPVKHAEDADSIEAHGPSSVLIETEIDTGTAGAAEAQALADTILARYKDPLPGVDMVVRLTTGTLAAVTSAQATALWEQITNVIGGPTERFMFGRLNALGTPLVWIREQQTLTWTPTGWIIELNLLKEPPA
jgi:hypothetical protein